MTEEYLLEVDELSKHFIQSNGLVEQLLGNEDRVHAVDNASLSLRPKESQAVIGESGCGKSTLLMTLMKLYDPTSGTIRYRGRDTSEYDRSDLKEYRSNVQVIFQDPYNSLDPRFTVKQTLKEPLEIHGMDNKEERIKDVCEMVELRPPEKYLNRVPDQLSGGEMQRVSIARALVVEPELLLADEPVSMLDVSTQASILNLLSELRNELDIAMLYISHDLSTVSYVADKINVMYLGRVVERGSTEEIINNPKHPYTKELINSVPLPNPYADRERTSLEGVAGNPINLGSGCRFRDRCPERMEVCSKTPVFLEDEEDHHVACHLYYDHDESADKIGGMTNE